MRKQIFTAIAARIAAQVPAIQHVDLWNEHIATITGGTAWPLPALFVEFEPYQVRQRGRHICEADVAVRLHIITRAAIAPAGASDTNANATLAHFDLLDAVHAALATLSGTTFTTLQLTECQTDHNHAELIESVERYVTLAVDDSAGRKSTTTTDAIGLGVVAQNIK